MEECAIDRLRAVTPEHEARLLAIAERRINGATYGDIAWELGISVTRVRQIEGQALRRLMKERCVMRARIASLEATIIAMAASDCAEIRAIVSAYGHTSLLVTKR